MKKEFKKLITYTAIGFGAVILFFIVFNICFFIRAQFNAASLNSQNTLDWVTEKGGINVSWGDLLSEMDNHGFHGDGSSLEVYQYTDSSMQSEMEESGIWNKLPLSNGLTELINNSLNDKCADAIPNISKGYYFYYDRYEGSTDPYDPSMIWNRSSINCTIALYDSDKDVLYIYKMDT